MEEREALKRQIELLQNLINKHKSLHGDTPFARVEQRHPEAPTPASGRCHNRSVREQQYAPQVHGSWRKTYSLKNKNPQSSVGHPSVSTSSSVDQSVLSHSISLPSHSKAQESVRLQAATVSSELTKPKEEGHISSVTAIREGVAKKTSPYVQCKRSEKAAVSQHEGTKVVSSSAGVIRHEKLGEKFPQKTESKGFVPVGKKVSHLSEVPSSLKANTSTSLQSNSQGQLKPSLTSKISTESKQTATQAVPMMGKTTPLPALSKVSKHSAFNPSSQKSQTQAGESFLKQSKFTWVKNQNIGGAQPRQSSPISSPTGKTVTVSPTSVSKPVVTGGSPSLTISRRTPAKKLPRKLNPVTIAPKTSKYRWVSSSAVTQAKTPQKPLSSKTLTLTQRAIEKADAAVKLKSSSTPSAKIKKGTSSSPSSRYRWKAGAQGSSVALTGAGTAARCRSAFHWTSEKSNKVVKGGLVSPLLPQRASLPSFSPGGFKLRSRMKIIRRSASSAYGTEKGSSVSAVKYSPRSRAHTLTRSPIGVRRTPSRELVSFGRHKLRRLSPTLSRTCPSPSSLRSPASQRVFRTRYKMVTRIGCNTANTIPYNPALSWRVKKIQSARSFLQNRRRAPHDRHPSSIHHWRGSSMCWIRGSLYQVSANKLSRTVASNTSINRTGRSSSPQVSAMVPAWNRHSTSRHLASRAVQRSLAIIRHARQKKQQKQYCMYYNRFGKCNRGSNCPYIHDPDKVAVCTRFLRGKCKQADGTCPFSHKLAKEKMPVCSYFLKGICNNSDCPYSHVYVSRKAEVCEDFVKGYCPEGEKCKRKHTLVCPDFSKTGSCPRGARCKLHHRLRAKRSASNTSTTPAKKARTKEASKRPRLSVVMPQDSPAATGSSAVGPLELPSFISLSSSPEEADTPDTLPVETSQVKEKKLQIKPRL